MYRRAIAIQSKKLGAGHPDLANQLNNRGEISKCFRKYQKMPVIRLNEAIAIWERELGEDASVLAYALDRNWDQLSG